MAVTLTDLRKNREWGIRAHQKWKAQLAINDAIGADRWEVVWDDDVVDDTGPKVENIYKGAFEDKVATAAVGAPTLFVPPRPGTTADRGERDAQKRRRVYQSYWDRSNPERLRMQFYGDWFHTGAWYTTPWTHWYRDNGAVIPPAERAVWFQRLDPRQAYPLSHDARGNLTEIMFIRRRRVAELEREYGVNHPGLTRFKTRREDKTQDPAAVLEEVWYFDNSTWAVAFADSQLPIGEQGRQFYNRDAWSDMLGGVIMEWATEPTLHRLGNCPVVEAKRMTHDGEYRGALEDAIHQMRIAQNIQARLLDDLTSNIYAPVVIDNVENPEDYGLGAVLIGTGEGKASIERDRPPVNFEGQRAVSDLVEGARKQSNWPVQRVGDPDASIVSGKGVNALAGSFNSELAWAQGDMEQGMMQLNRVAAAFDEHHAPGKKQIDGLEGVTSWHETYDPTVLFNGDYRNKVTYGDRRGLESQQYLTNLAMGLNLQGMARRTFMEKSGLVDDVLAEEIDMHLERMIDLIEGSVFPKQAEMGDFSSIIEYIRLLDEEKETVRSAVLQVAKSMNPAPGAAAAAGGAGGPQDIMQMMASLNAGGIPGNAEGLPAPPGIGDQLSNVLPSDTRRLAESNP